MNLRVLGRLAMAMCLAIVSTPTPAQSFPDRPLRLVVPFSAGGVTDIVARAAAERLSRSLGQTVVVENRTGANGAVAIDTLMQAPPDGYTLFLATIGNLAINPAVYPDLRYSTDKDFQIIGLLSSVPQLFVVGKALPVNSVDEFVAYAKANPGKLSYGSSGVGSAPHMAGAIFASRAGIQVNHIPYRGSSQSITDLIGGQLSFMIDPVTTTLPYVQSGKVRAIAVSTPHRLAALPDVPTIAESGFPGYDVGVWNAIAVRAGTPAPVVDRLVKELRAVVQDASFARQIATSGAEPLVDNPEGARRFIAAEQQKYADIIRRLKIRAE